MKKLNKNPFAWFVIVLIISYFIIGNSSNFEGLVIFILAIILSKQIEIINFLEKEK